MSEKVAEQFVSVEIPGSSELVTAHHRRAVAEVGGMSPSRKTTADTNHRIWRRWVKRIDPNRENGWAFAGVELMAASTASLPAGAIIVACDVSWAQAKWYAGRYIKPIEIEASLYEVTTDGLTLLKRSVRRKWAHDLVGWLLTNRADIPVKETPTSMREIA
jgi:hypothetical protein